MENGSASIDQLRAELESERQQRLELESARQVDLDAWRHRLNVYIHWTIY